MKFIVIGGDAAGMSAASRARRRNPDLEIIVFEQSRDVSYSACGMPYNIADRNRDIEELVVRKASVFREKQKIDLRTKHRVDSIDPGSKSVSGCDLSGKEFCESYDRLLIATGASPIVPNLLGFDLPGVMALKTLEDGRKIKKFIRENNVKKAVIIGMGYIALEMCESLRNLEIDVDMVKPRLRFMPWMNAEMAEIVKKKMESNAIGLFPGHEIKKIVKSDGGLKVVCSDIELSGEMVLVAIGVKPNSRLAKDAGLNSGPDNSIDVDGTCMTSGRDIYAAGDCADAFHVVTGKKTWLPLALIANRGGWAVADNITGKRKEIQGIAGTAVFKVFELQVARTGLNVEQGKEVGFEAVDVTIQGRTRAHAHPGASPIWVNMVGDRKSGRLLGAQIVSKEGAAHRINAIAVALHAKMNVEDFTETDLAYAPPFGPVWDPMLTAANQLMKKL